MLFADNLAAGLAVCLEDEGVEADASAFRFTPGIVNGLEESEVGLDRGVGKAEQRKGACLWRSSSQNFFPLAAESHQKFLESPKFEIREPKKVRIGWIGK